MVTKAVILAGGYGTRLMEETEARPKPMVEIGGKPMLWHIMKIFSCSGINDFIIPLGYKGHMIKQYFAEYHLHAADVTIDFTYNQVTVLKRNTEPWRITLVDTGLDTMTGGRLLRCKPYLSNEPFCMTYGDGVIGLDLRTVIDQHAQYGKIATLTAVRPPSRFGALSLQGPSVTGFAEKPYDEGSWINGGFMVLSPRVFDFIEDDSTVFERGPLERLTQERELGAYRHEGFWHSMDTLRDKRHLEDLWAGEDPPWKMW